ncbi:hypothetical protein V5N11_005685 [Cardamine amara subsp. amara]|uniref:Uncharacterized protein n=1 Tax=Cardamine amara subsp. amara TaxID=228776 RepID=A0ABD1BIB6_CARAN
MKRKFLKEQEAKLQSLGEVLPKKKLIVESDPLFGIIEDHPIDICPLTGNPKIDKTFVDGMRQYLQMAEGAERLARGEHIKASLEVLKSDPIGQKIMLRLEEAPIISVDVNKGKSIVFNYERPKSVRSSGDLMSLSSGKLLGTAIRVGHSVQIFYEGPSAKSKGVFERLGGVCEEVVEDNQGSSTVNRTGIFQASSLGTTLIKKYKRKRPSKAQRQKAILKSKESLERKVDTEEGSGSKRNAEDKVTTPSKFTRRTSNEVVPSEGSSNH